MKRISIVLGLLTILLLTTLTSCEIIMGIFKAGVNVGIFIVIAVIVLIVGIMMGLFKRKS